MRCHVLRYLFCAFLIITTGCAHTDIPQEFYVSPDGDDVADGSFETPFASITAARNAIRRATKHGDFPDGGITVYLRGGAYMLESTVDLSSEDSGKKDAPVIYCSYPGETVRIIGGRVLSKLTPVTERKILERIPEAAREHVVTTSLDDEGVSAYKNLNADTGSTLDIFFDGEYMPIAGYPNKGSWLTVSGVPLDSTAIHQGDPRTLQADGSTRGEHSAMLAFADNRPRTWDHDGFDDIILHGYWYWDWSDACQELSSIDAAGGIIHIAEPYHFYGYRAGQRFRFLNVLEELDSPGEWHIDRETGALTFWPPSDLNGVETIASVIDTPLFRLNNTHYIAIRDIIFEGTRSTAISVEGGSNNKISGCVLRNTGGPSIVIRGGTYNGVTSCDIYNIATAGIVLDGGERRLLKPGHNFAVNNHIHHYNRRKRIGPAINMTGVGNILSHNQIHDAPHAAVYFSGNEHVLEYNEVHDVALETGDVGAFYIGRDWTCRGNIIRHNYFHHIHGPGHGGARPVYLDDWSSGTTVYGNIFYDATYAVLIGGGRDNTVENNIFIDCLPSVHVDARGIGWARNYFDTSHPNHQHTLFDRMEAMRYDKPPYRDRYPELMKLYEDEPALPKYNRIVRNISSGGRFIDLLDGVDLDLVAVTDNYIADPVLARMVSNTDNGSLDSTYTASDVNFVDLLERHGNIVAQDAPVFRNIPAGDFALIDDSPMSAIGFVPIPVDSIGLYRDEYRTVLP